MIFSHRGFTLIEMMIVISIIAVMSAMMYAPFSYYQKLGVLRAGSNTLLQSVYSAKTFAANGVFLSGAAESAPVVLYIAPPQTLDVYSLSGNIGDFSPRQEEALQRFQFDPIINFNTVDTSPRILLFTPPDGSGSIWRRSGSIWAAESGTGIHISVSFTGVNIVQTESLFLTL